MFPEQLSCTIDKRNRGKFMNRKIMTLACIIALAGCTQKGKQPASSVQQTPEIEEKETVWFHEPDLDYDKAQELAPLPYVVTDVNTQKFGEITLYTEEEKTGSPGTWSGMDYSSDVLVVEKNNLQGLVRHDGSELYPISVNLMVTPYQQGIVNGLQKTGDNSYKPVYGFADTSTSKASVIASDFSSVSEIDISDFNYDLNNDSTKRPYLALRNGQTGIAGMTYSSSGAMNGWDFEPWTPAGFENNIIVPEIDDAMKTTGHAVLGPDGTFITELNGEMPYREGSYVNDFYVISDGNYASVIDAKSGTGIAIQYNDAKYFNEGYCPVKKAGRWGYVDQNGKEVTDFIFQDAGIVNNGKAWVKWNDHYGIIDMSVLNSSDKQVNAYWLAPPAEEAIGTAEVLVSDLTIRTGPSTDQPQAGNACMGSVYPIFEEKTTDNLTWYRINKDMWIADDGTWLNVTKK